VPWADEAEKQLSRIAPSGCQLSADVRIFDGGLPERDWQGLPPIPSLRFKFEVTRQASSPSLCASVQVVPWADEAEQQLSRLEHSGCQLSAEVRIFGAGLPELPGTDPQSYVGILRWEDKQAAPVSVPLCEQYHAQMRLLLQFSRLAPIGCQLSAEVRIFGPGLPEGTW